ncbi:patch domain-containing 3-like [Octopus vulgaris]|uniref:Patch domain-containing 3-like n=1 Tax=Octopus vulgaris TaxID=6645 RepID=A0AA36AY80_OCTVU|nr:patch domain-containing 3-like [Octopus vulgaris]
MAVIHAVVGNIPAKYHSKDLRNFFSSIVETDGFDCFHYRHRPEVKRLPQKQLPNNHDNKSLSSCCCVIRVPEARFEDLFDYNERHWINEKGESMKSQCHIRKIRFSCQSQDQIPYKTREEQTQIPEDREVFTKTDLENLPELHAPTVMPKGNVGTPTYVFLELINQCKLPPRIISKLQLEFPKVTYNNIYGRVPCDYDIQCLPSSGNTLETGSRNENFQKNLSKRKLNLIKNQFSKRQKENTNEATTTTTNTTVDDDSSRSCNDSLRTDANIDASTSCHLGVSANNESRENGTDISLTTSENLHFGANPHSSHKIQIHLPHSNGRIVCDKLEKNDVKISQKTDVSEKRRLKMEEKARRKQNIAEMKRKMALNIEEKMIEFDRGSDYSEEDADYCEEWERHEALHDDPSGQERNKERLFEDDIELKWEKGGSGLVFYTDAQYWQQEEGDFDEQTADDWDVDMRGYYEPGSEDMDGRDFIAMRQKNRLSEDTGYKDSVDLKIGKFEKHTRGFGRKIMEQLGWKEGEGLGTTSSGMAEALENFGKNPYNKSGIGFRKSQLSKKQWYMSKREEYDCDIPFISTIYDNPSITDPEETLLRRNEPYQLKRRK